MCWKKESKYTYKSSKNSKQSFLSSPIFTELIQSTTYSCPLISTQSSLQEILIY